MEVRLANMGDIPGLISLLLQVGQVHHDLRPDIFRPRTLKYDETALETLLLDPQRPVFVAAEGSFVAGYCFCVHRPYKDSGIFTDRRELYIDDLCVDEKIRRMGTGKILYDFIVRYAREIGCYNLTLNVWACNPSAMAFYEKQGLVMLKKEMEMIL
jgi:ribosomal protein S18 acetylase RimI-like enzyme